MSPDFLTPGPIGIAQAGSHLAWKQLQGGKHKVVLARHHDSGKRAMALQYPHRALVAPRVRVTVDYLLDKLTAHEALHITPAQLRQFAA